MYLLLNRIGKRRNKAKRKERKGFLHLSPILLPSVKMSSDGDGKSECSSRLQSRHLSQPKKIVKFSTELCHTLLLSSLYSHSPPSLCNGSDITFGCPYQRNRDSLRRYLINNPRGTVYTTIGLACEFGMRQFFRLRQGQT